MKKIYLAFITLSLLFVAVSCDKDLPYPIDEVKRGVVIDVVRVKGTDGVLSDGLTTGNYKINLSIPEQQGDYSFMKEAQLLAVLQGVDGKMKSEVVIANITEFPKEITIDVADVYSKFGLTTPSLGETLYFTTNTVLKDDVTVPGWNQVIGFNNKAFAGWQVDGRAYSYNVRYSVACELILDDFIGTNTVYVDEWDGGGYTVEIIKVSDTELRVEGMFSGYGAPMTIKVDPTDHSISIPKQILVANPTAWWGNPSPYSNFALAGGGTINACETSLSFTAEGTVDQGSFGGGIGFKIGK